MGRCAKVMMESAHSMKWRNNAIWIQQADCTDAEHTPAAQRYINHKECGSEALLFAGELKTDRVTDVAESRTYLGTADYVKYEGFRPMNIAWKLDRPIPAKSLKKTNKLMIS